MEDNICNLHPTGVWKHFYELTQIPRPSGYKTEITAFVEAFGKKLGLKTTRDNVGNICIRKPATPSYETRPTVILQSHLDMVPQANSNTSFDFKKNKIQVSIDGEWVKANGTTLGADNGIGVAATMAILEATDLQHGTIEGLFTVDEEIGMCGALAVQSGFIDGKIMLNLDSEVDGELFIGCAGGADVTVRFQYENETWIQKEEIAVRISLTGLKGGHSGIDIHLGRANANQLMFRFLKDASLTYGIRLSSVTGGSIRNAIPREAFVVILADGMEQYERICEMVTSYEVLFNKEFANTENKITFKAECIPITPEIKLIPKHIQKRLTQAIVSCPNNVINRFADLSDIVETSVNMAIVKSIEDRTDVKFLVRSSSEGKKAAICDRIKSIFMLVQADIIEINNDYSGWNPNPNSATLRVMKRVFEEQRGVKPAVKIMHAGLECGIILANVPGLDVVSFGPTIKFPHSPDERVEIGSVQRFWEYLTAILKNI